MTKKARKKTNIEVLINLMDFGKNGALMQAFIMNALERYSDSVIEQSTEPEGWPSMLNWDAWRECAVEMNETLNKHYERTV